MSRKEQTLSNTWRNLCPVVDRENEKKEEKKEKKSVPTTKLSN